MRQTIFAILTAATLIAAAPAVPPPNVLTNVLTYEGLGPVTMGMTVAQADRALGARLKMIFSEDNDPMSCGTGVRADGRNSDVVYMVMKGRIVRIGVMRMEEGAPSNPAVRTAKNIGLGATEAQVRAAYPNVKVEPHPYGTENDHYMIVDTPDKKRGLIFETTDGKVTSFRAGVYPEVGYIEGCA
jgi:hypothetical protein